MICFFHILDLNLKSSYQIASLFHMYMDMGERIAGKQDRPSLIIEGHLRAPQIATNIKKKNILGRAPISSLISPHYPRRLLGPV